MNKLVLSTALSALMVSAAFAQAPAPTNPSTETPSATAPATSTMPSSATTAPKFVTSQSPDQWLSSKFKGTDVVGADDAKIGDVSDILFDKSGKIEAFVVSVGGFLGVGSKDVAIAPDAFQVVKGANNEADKLKLAATKDELKQAQNFEAYNPPRTTTGSASGLNGARPGGAMSPPAPATSR